MSIFLTLIWGPTSTGKTAASIALANAIDAPVIALDRLQCYPEISTGSGRPLVAELQGSQRIYLAERKLSDGIISGKEANMLLKRCVNECAGNHPEVLLEGGSISLLNEMMADPYWCNGYSWSFRRFRLGDPAVFVDRARQRVRKMFHLVDAPSLLEELVLAWSNPANRLVIDDVDGYRAAIGFARRHGLSIPDLLHMKDSLEDELIDEVAQEFLQHARWQEEAFLPIPSTWKHKA